MNKHPNVTVTVCPPMPAAGVADLNDYVHSHTYRGGKVAPRSSGAEWTDDTGDARSAVVGRARYARKGVRG